MRTPSGHTPSQDVRVDDLLLSRDECNPSGLVVAQRVEEVFVREGLILELKVLGRTIRTTAEHPFHRYEDGWVACNQLLVGDRIALEEGWAEVVGLVDTGSWETVYNFRIAEFHTYFVGCDEWGFSVWAHNAACTPGDVLAAAAGKLSADEAAAVAASINKAGGFTKRSKKQANAFDEVAEVLRSKGIDVDGGAALQLRARFGDLAAQGRMNEILGAPIARMIDDLVASGVPRESIMMRSIERKGFDLASIEARAGITHGSDASRVSAQMHVGGNKRLDNPWISTTRSSDSAVFFGTHRYSQSMQPVVILDMRQIPAGRLLDISTISLAKGVTPPLGATSRAYAVKHQEVLVRHNIPQDAIIGIHYPS